MSFTQCLVIISTMTFFVCFLYDKYDYSEVSVTITEL